MMAYYGIYHYRLIVDDDVLSVSKWMIGPDTQLCSVKMV